MLCPVCGTWIAADVVADRRLAGRERFERVRAAIRRTLQVEERPHDLERIWTRAGVRDERQAPRDVLAQPDPGEKKPSFIDGNPAGALEQRLGVAFADDQLVDVAQHRVGSIELPDVMFGLRSLGHVDVTPDHPRGLAGRVAIQLAARIHPAPRSVLVPHPELDFVGAYRVGQIPFEASQRRRTIVWMEAVAPFREVVADLVFLEAELTFPLARKDGGPGAEIPVPDPDVRRLHGKPQPLAAFAKLRFTHLAIGDVVRDPQHRGDPSRVVAQRCRVRGEAAAPAFEADDLEFECRGFAAEDPSRERAERFPLLGYDQCVDEVIANLIQRVGLDHPEAGRIHFEERALFGDQLDALGFRFENGAPTRLACRQLAIGVLELLRPVVRVLRGGCGNGSGGGLLVVQLVWHRALHAHTRRSRHRWQGHARRHFIAELGRPAFSRGFTDRARNTSGRPRPGGTSEPDVECLGWPTRQSWECESGAQRRTGRSARQRRGWQRPAAAREAVLTVQAIRRRSGPVIQASLSSSRPHSDAVQGSCDRCRAFVACKRRIMVWRCRGTFRARQASN